MTRTQDLASRVGASARRSGLTVGTAESLTGGTVATALAAAPQASEWFQGSVVAYSPRVKQDVLGVTPGPVLTERCALEMARGAARLLEVDAAVSATGVGGPDPEEGEPPGTVWVAVVAPAGETCHRLALRGSPAEVVELAAEHALELLLGSLAVEDGFSEE
ncbi:CinA family protein [Ornithinimicrobium avium]|uniref:CinA family protein n=1 Tax=Ornithinimicrobium avium TaxID=2283195 RepID=A0A345NJW1_9MICO|nr:CinA family protein [Ornithinimicrobium avium]AXH95319.1 CinA family protein [Ornithinimicrobium avium]